MNSWIDDFTSLIVFVISLIILITIICFIGSWVDFHCTKEQIVDVYVNKKIVYTGSKACVKEQVNNLNEITKIEIRDRYLCLHPKEFYMTKDVEILPHKEVKDEI